MKKTLTIFSIFLLIIHIKAQTYQEIYLQQELTRLNKLKDVEIEIETFISQNINTYNFTDVIASVDTTNGETGQPLSSDQYQTAVTIAKRQKLRDLFFTNNPEKYILYFSKALQQCVNGGFEDNGGSTSGYSFAWQNYSDSGWNSSNNYPFQIIPVPPLITPPHQYATLVNSSSADPNIPSIPRVYSGNYAIKFNQSQLNVYSRSVTSMRRQFIVNESTVSYAYAIFFQNPIDGGHEGDIKYPYYKVRLINSNNQTVFQKVIDTSTPGLNYNASNNLLYTGWRCERININRFLGQLLTLEITVSNCGNSGHIGYGYFDDFCGLDNNCIPVATPSINLNPQKETYCPTMPMNVNGNYTIPSAATFSSVELDILDLTGNVVNTLPTTSATVSGNYFNFIVNYNNFYPTGVYSNLQFNFRVRLKYILGGVQQTLTVINTNPPGPDVSFRGCNIPCFENIQITDVVSTSNNYQVSNTIYAHSLINPNLNVNYRAENQIHLLPGFYVTGYDYGKFHAYIASCEENSYLTQKSSKRSSASTNEVSIKNSEITIYPNPASAYFKISTGNEKLVSWELYDMSGKFVLTGKSAEADVQNLLKGIYILKINLETRQVNKTLILK
jgi:hypothetical protein